jgi:hypothetical protein
LQPERDKEGIMALWDDVKTNLVEWYTLTSDKTTEVARVGSRRWDKFGISRDIERQFSELGSLVYVGLKDGAEDILAGEAVQSLVKRIENLESELVAKNEEIENIRAEYARAAAAGGPDTPEEAGVEETGPLSETVITDPVLEMGSEDSAILVEPMDTPRVDETEEAAAPKQFTEGEEDEPKVKE